MGNILHWNFTATSEKQKKRRKHSLDSDPGEIYFISRPFWLHLRKHLSSVSSLKFALGCNSNFLRQLDWEASRLLRISFSKFFCLLCWKSAEQPEKLGTDLRMTTKIMNIEKMTISLLWHETINLHWVTKWKDDFETSKKFIFIVLEKIRMNSMRRSGKSLKITYDVWAFDPPRIFR